MKFYSIAFALFVLKIQPSFAGSDIVAQQTACTFSANAITYKTDGQFNQLGVWHSSGKDRLAIVMPDGLSQNPLIPPIQLEFYSGKQVAYAFLSMDTVWGDGQYDPNGETPVGGDISGDYLLRTYIFPDDSRPHENTAGTLHLSENKAGSWAGKIHVTSYFTGDDWVDTSPLDFDLECVRASSER